ncbi:MAG: carbon storage regulator CsrA [Sedimentisphaerales bacterium]|jgi:carbon storage regulator
MLVLSRHKDESIMVGDNVEIMIVGIRRNEIQLGINAPKSIPVHRKEVYGRICRGGQNYAVAVEHNQDAVRSNTP